MITVPLVLGDRRRHIEGLVLNISLGRRVCFSSFLVTPATQLLTSGAAQAVSPSLECGISASDTPDVKSPLKAMSQNV